jgi:hypothetical protein
MLRSLIIPRDFAAILKVFKQFKRQTFVRWRDLPNSSLSKEEARLISEIRATSSNFHRVIGAVTLARYSPSNQDCSRDVLISCSIDEGHPTVSSFILKCFARQCRENTPIWNDFSVQMISKYCKIRDNLKFSLQFVKYLVSEASFVAKTQLNTLFSLLYDAAFEGEKDLAFSVLSDFLNDCDTFIITEPILSNLCLKFRSENAEIALEFAARLFKHYGSKTPQFEWQILVKLLQTGTEIIKGLSAEALLYLQDRTSAVFPQITKNLFSFENPRIVLLLHLWNSGVMRDQVQRILNLLVSLPLRTENAFVIMQVCRDVDQHELLMRWFIEQIELNLFETLTFLTNETLEFSEKEQNQISKAAMRIWANIELKSDIRRLVPKLLRTLSLTQYHRYFDILFNSLFTESDTQIRLEILDCFVQPFPKTLMQSPILKHFCCLIDDPDERIRLRAIEFIISLDQTLIVSVLRLNLDNLSHRQMAESAALWSALFPFFPGEIVREYPTFFKEAVSFLESRLTEGLMTDEPLTSFAIHYRQTTTVAYLKALSYFAISQFDLIQPTWETIIDLLLRLLSLGMTKTETIEILRLILILAQGVGVELCRNHPSLYNCLFSLGATIRSREIHELLFRIFGYIGVMRRPESQMSFWIDEDEHFLNLNRTLLSKSPDQTQFFSDTVLQFCFPFLKIVLFMDIIFLPFMF